MAHTIQSTAHQFVDPPAASLAPSPSAPFAASSFYETWMHEGTGDRERWVLNHPFGAWHFKFAEQFAEAYADRALAPLRERAGLLEKDLKAAESIVCDRDMKLAALREQANILIAALLEISQTFGEKSIATVRDVAKQALSGYRDSGKGI